MNVAEVLAPLQRIAGRVQNEWTQSPDLALRARAAVDTLRRCCPGANLCACFLTSSNVSELVVINGAGQEEDAWRDRLDPRAASSGVDLRVAWCEHFQSAGQCAVVQPIDAEQGSFGLLAVQLGKTHTSQVSETSEVSADESSIATILSAIASILALRLNLEALGRENQQLREAMVESERLACVGEIAGPLAHEFTNFLNALLLKAAVLGHQLPGEHRSDLAEIRRQGLLANEAVCRFFQYRRNHSGRRPVNVNQMVMEVAHEFERTSPVAMPIRVVPASSLPENGRQNTISLTLDLAPDVPLAQSAPADLRRLMRFLLTNAVRAAVHSGKGVMVETRNNGGRAILGIEDTGPTPTPADLLRLFDVSHPTREGVDALELAASWSIARRLNCEIRPEARSGCGLRLCVTIDVA